MKIYRLINEIHSDKFQVYINDHLKDGWELYGSPTYGVSDVFGVYYMQAVTKEVEEGTNWHNAQPYSREEVNVK